MSLNKKEFDGIIEEYKEYMMTNAFNRTFDFNTWCQHQYGEILNDVAVKPVLNFEVHGNVSHK